MLYYFILYPDAKRYNIYITRECDNMGDYHCIALIRGKEVFSGSRGQFIANEGDYVLWTRETNNIKIE